MTKPCTKRQTWVEAGIKRPFTIRTKHTLLLINLQTVCLPHTSPYSCYNYKNISPFSIRKGMLGTGVAGGRKQDRVEEWRRSKQWEMEGRVNKCGREIPLTQGACTFALISLIQMSLVLLGPSGMMTYPDGPFSPLQKASHSMYVKKIMATANSTNHSQRWLPPPPTSRQLTHRTLSASIGLAQNVVAINAM